MIFKPKYITFDCYGTLTYFRMHEVAYSIVGEQLPPERMQQFIKDFSALRLDEAMGDWKPYDQVLKSAWARVCKRHGITYREEDGQKFYDAVPTWGPHTDVPHALTRVGNKIPLVILSNAMNDQIHSNVRKLEAPVPQGLHGAGRRRLQAAPESLRVHARPAGLQPGRHPARVLQPALRPDVGP